VHYFSIHNWTIFVNTDKMYDISVEETECCCRNLPNNTNKNEGLTDLELSLDATFAPLTVVDLARVVIIHNLDKFT